MDKSELQATLAALDGHLSAPCDVLVVGGAAMILHFGAARATQDVDAFVLRGDITELRRAVAAVALERSLSEHWLNDAVKGFVDILPSDFRRRIMALTPHLDCLHLYALGLPDQVAMKAVALREQDLEDLDLLLPRMTESDRHVLLAIIEHVSRIRPDWAMRIRYFLLEQGWTID